jgi:hypothetical protein
MPRARAFDHDQGFDRAMRLFWRARPDRRSLHDIVNVALTALD